MTLNEYQKAAKLTAIYPNNGFEGYTYCALKLNGEAGEVAELVGKTMRGDYGMLPAEKLKKELGDVLWYVANLAHDLGFNLSDVAQANLNKLRSRAERGVLKGSGSDR
jgi:NTP pyrophosphatase (non-canonical NTP hydrolase)